MLLSIQMGEDIPEGSELGQPETSLSKAPYKSQYFASKSRGWQEIMITPVRLIGDGNFGIVFEADVEIAGKRRRFAVKRIKQEELQRWRPSLKEMEVLYTGDETTMKQRMETDRSITLIGREGGNYRRAKKAGLKVFPTCRYTFGQHGAELLMTRGHSQDWVCLGDKGRASCLSFFGEEKMAEILNFKEIIRGMLDQAKLGYELGIYIGADAYFFLVNLKDKKSLDFVLGDIGSLKIDEQQRRSKEVWQYNLNHVRLALSKFLEKNVNNERFNESVNYVDQEIEEISKANSINQKTIERQRKIRCLRWLLLGR